MMERVAGKWSKWWCVLVWLPVAFAMATEASSGAGQGALTAGAPRGGEGPPAPGAMQDGPRGGPGFVLEGVCFEEDGALPSAGRNEVIAPFLGQWTTLADLEELRYRLTKFYTDQGYLNSGVIVVPGQTIEDGEVCLRVITGRLAEVRVSGQGRLRPHYLTKRLQRDPEAPLNRAELQERFQLLLEDPLIEQLDGELLPGLTPGEAVLDLAVTPARPWDAFVRIDNHRPPSTGAERVYVGGALRNLTGHGDVLDWYLGRGFEGQGREGSIGWSIPLNARDTRLSLRYERSDSSLLEEPLVDLDIDSETQRAELGLAHPLWRNLKGHLELAALLGWAENKTTLSGEGFSFSAGSVDGESRVTALRLRQSLLHRTANAAYALRSTLSFGLDTFDATIHPDDLPDGQFFAWQGQGQAVWRLNDRDTRLILRGGVQLAGDRLLSLERFAVGGTDSVRGYRENEQVGDNGYSLSIEARHPVWDGPVWGMRQVVQLALFGDAGSAWGRGEWDGHEDLAAVGIGLLWTAEERLRAELYWGHALSEPQETEEHNLQDDGVHFMVQADF